MYEPPVVGNRPISSRTVTVQLGNRTPDLIDVNAVTEQEKSPMDSGAFFL
jgi:hypothetical protein